MIMSLKAFLFRWKHRRSLEAFRKKMDAETRSAETYLSSCRDLADAPEVRTLLASRVPVTYLRPLWTASPLPLGTSKMGGEPNLVGVEDWPVCPHCGVPLLFVLQIYKHEFPEMWFPEGKNLFQIYRCRRASICPDVGPSENLYDYYTVGRFLFASLGEERRISCPETSSETYDEKPPVECQFSPYRTGNIDFDHIDSEKFADGVLGILSDILRPRPYEPNYEKEHPGIAERVLKVFGPPPHGYTTKINGVPDWQQDSDYPISTRGQVKRMFFQLGSADKTDRKLQSRDGREYNAWSDHDLMFGDLGNIYFFCNPDEGEESVETRFDCG